MSMVIFAIMQFINVILSTLRSICTIKSGKHIGMLMNVISYTFYAAVVKLLTAQELWFVVAVTAVTNCIGFYIAEWIFQSAQKDKLWRISATIKTEGKIIHQIDKAFDRYNITYNKTVCTNGAVVYDIFSKSQGESHLVKEITQKYKMKYHVIEIDKKL